MTAHVDAGDGASAPSDSGAGPWAQVQHAGQLAWFASGPWEEPLGWERPGIRLAVVTVTAATAAEVAAVPPGGIRGPGQPWELWEASLSIHSPRGPGPAASTQILALAQCWDGNCWCSGSKLCQ